LSDRTSAKRRYILTGTPVANKPDDLWSQFYFLDDGASLRQTFDEFRSKYRGDGGGYVELDDLREKVAQISKRRLKDHAVALPPKQIRRLGVRMTGRQRQLYEEMRNELAIWVRSMDGAEVVKQGEAILARLVRLAQLASNPGVLDASYDETPCKFAAIDGLLSEAMSDATRKAIIWTSFVENIPALQKRFSALSPVSLHGSLSSSQRDRSIRAFKEDASVRLMVANPAAAREGLTLTQANLTIYLDRTFNLVDYLQSQDRIHRISQTKPCEVILLVVENSIDEFVDFSLEQKSRLAKFVQMDSGSVSSSDTALEKPAVLRALLAPEH
jgi:SNF2 family DNA or RNA helicase